ncbi:MAG: hypothetical protein V1729_04410 [Candidatus Woesearchaeota archaeon]
MREMYETLEQKTAGMQMLPVLNEAWKRKENEETGKKVREVDVHEQNMLLSYAVDVGLTPQILGVLSEQYRSMQRYSFKNDKELRHVGQEHGVDKWVKVRGEDRLLDRMNIGREYKQFLRFADLVYSARVGRDVNLADRSSDAYANAVVSLMGDFGHYFYLINEVASTDLESLKGFITEGINLYDVPDLHLPSSGDAFDRVETEMMNKLNAGTLKSGEFGVRKFFENRFGKTYNGGLELVKESVGESGEDLYNIVMRASLGESDIFKDSVEFTEACIPFLQKFSRYAELMKKPGISGQLSHVYRRRAEANFDAAHLVARKSAKRRELVEYRQGQFSDLKALVGILAVTLEDGVIKQQERDLFQAMALATGIPENLRNYLLEEDVARKVVAHPEFRGQ